MSTCCSLKIWILFLWAERLQIKQSMRWSICSGESAFLQNFIDISAKKKIYLSQRSRCRSSWCARDSWWIYQSGKRKSSNASTISDVIQRHISVHLLAHFSWNLHHRDKMLMQQQLTVKNPSNQNQKENVQIQSNAIAKSNDLLNDAKKSENKKDRNWNLKKIK